MQTTDDLGVEEVKSSNRLNSAGEGYRRTARQAVSAEPCGEWNRPDAWSPPKHAKSEEDRFRILGMLQSSFLFSSVDKEGQQVLAEAMEEIRVPGGTILINEGEDGDFLCVVDSGSLQCYKPTTSDDPDLILKECLTGDVFGELALLYNAPRAASVRTVTDCVLWKLDRRTFTFIVRDRAFNKRAKFFAFLKSVPILSVLGEHELTQVADALKPREYLPEETIVLENDENADVFYILESGTANAFKGPRHVLNYATPGEYFGELALLRNEPRAATLKAGPGGCTALLLDRDSFKRLLGDLEELLKQRKYEE